MKTRIPALILCLVLLLSVIPTVTTTAATPIPTVNITGFRLPAVGQKAEDNLKTLSVPAGAKYYISEAYWIDTYSSLSVSSDSAFKESAYYLKVVVAPLSGYSVENAKPYFDGSQTYVDTDYTRMEGNTMVFFSIDVYASTGKPGIDVNVTGFHHPIVGQKAEDNLKTLDVPADAHYYISDAYWVNADQHDTVSGSQRFGNDLYYLKVVVSPHPGYSLEGAHPFLNGSAGNIDSHYTRMDGDSLVFYSLNLYAVESKDIITADVTGFRRPTLGQTAAENLETLSVPAGAKYYISEAYWYNNKADRFMADLETFAADATYYLKVVLRAKTGFSFANGAEILLNGKSTDVDTDYGGEFDADFLIYSLDFTPSGGTAAKKGDVNGDSVLNAFDYQMVKAYVLGTFPSASSAQIAAMDVNGDGNINAFDYQMIKAAVLGTYTFS